MAKQKPLRIFFGWFLRAGGSDYATNLTGFDALYPWFLTGKVVSSDNRVHNRRPIGADGDIQEWDEYLDLRGASAEIAKAGEIHAFRDTMGVEDVLVWQPNINFDFIPGNVLQIETYLNEFFFPTKMLSKPIPTATATPEILWTPDSSDVVAGLIDSKHEIWLHVELGGTASTAVKLQVNKYTGSNELCFRISGAYGGGRTITIARANFETHSVHEELIWSDYPREVTGIIDYNLETGVDPNIVVTAKGGGWYEVQILDFFSRTYSSGNVLVLPAENSALHRVAFDFERRHRINVAAPFNLTQTWLVLDAETNRYYKGFLEGVSPAFFVGVGKRTEDTAQLLLRILEEGSFMPSAWTDPNDSNHFIAWAR